MSPKVRRLSGTPFTSGQFQATLANAKCALGNAYAPYSMYRVGCAVFCADHRIFTGCNVETANYDGTHAEEAALAAMVVAGRRDPVLCVCVAASAKEPPALVMSCGKCRQTLMEFSSLTEMEIWIPAAEDRFVKLSDILPYHFGPRDLGVDLYKYRR